MKTTLGKAGLTKTWQNDFPEQVNCVHCLGKAHIAFVAHEDIDKDDKDDKEGKNVYHLRKTTGRKGGLWLHDSCAVAVYFCTKCLQPTARYNQG